MKKWGCRILVALVAYSSSPFIVVGFIAAYCIASYKIGIDFANEIMKGADFE